MRLPEFTAEASLGKTRESYILTSGTEAEAGRVLPQAVISHCWTADGYSGCFTLTLVPLRELPHGLSGLHFGTD